MLIDEVKIKLRGGHGGDGIASFKNALMERGPTGGNGGNGGDVYVVGITDLGALRQFRHKKNFAAENGRTGSNRGQDGANGGDLILNVPVGTVVRNLDLKQDHEITKIGEKFLIAHGAHGGFGNAHFKSSTNVTPRQASPGHKAREFEVVLELKLIADVGLVGLPNAGKSSLLNSITSAQSKVANYHFTTLEPHLGTYYGLILADIPGLIEGASEGKGLGTKFLRHISRCRVLFHLISCETQDPVRDYKTIRNELKTYDKALAEKPEYVFLSKTDEVEGKRLKELALQLKKSVKNVYELSIIGDGGLDDVKEALKKVQDLASVKSE